VQNQAYSIDLCLPPLAVVLFKLDRPKTRAALEGSAT
jgi:1,4-alpha-glucan branching enzyme